MTTGYNVVDSCVLFSFSRSLRFFSYLRAVTFGLCFIIIIFFILTLCSFFFWNGKQRVDFGNNDSESVGPLHSMSRTNVYDLLFNSISFFRFLFAKVKWSSICFLFFCYVRNRQWGARAHALTALAWRFSRRRDRVCGGDVNVSPPVLSSVHPQFAPSCSSIQMGQ